MSGSVPQPAEPGVPSPAEPVAPVAPIDRTGGYLGPAGAAAVAAASRATPARWRLLLRRPMFWVGAGILAFWVVCAVFGYLFAPYNPLAQNLLSANIAPSSAHWFGTDPLGRDVLSRVITGARYILIITPLATLLGTVLGTALGLAMGYLGGAFDAVAGRLVEAVLALPFVIIAFMFVVALGPSVPVITVVIGLVFTPLIARTVRTAVLVERHMDYVPAARLLGLALRDTLLTAEEYQAMADGLADTDGPATGETSLNQWITDHKGTLGRTYANELDRHFR